MDEFEYRGDWWLPEDPDNHVSGVLTYAPNAGLRLDLDGSFKSFDMIALFRPPSLDHPIILGVTRTGKAITLYKCYERTGLERGYELSQCIAEIGIVGHHFQRVEEIRFTGITASYTHLPEWIGLSGFRGDISRRSVSVTYRYPKPITAKLDAMTVTCGVGYKSDMQRQKRVIEQTGYIQFAFRRQHHIDQCADILQYMREFLALGMSEPTTPTSVYAKRRRSKEEHAEPTNSQIDIYFSAYPLVSIDRELYSPRMLFTLHDVQEGLDTYLQHWFSMATTLRAVFDLYFGTLFNKQGYASWVFLNYIQAIEAYHRRVAPNSQYVSEEEFTPIWEKLVAGIPQDKQVVGDAFRDSLKQRMKYMYEYSLKKRLRLILKKHKDQVALLIPDIDPFIDDVVTKRNHLTHYTEELERLAVKGEEFSLLIQRVRFLIEVCFLWEIGIPPDRITQIMQRSSRYQRVAQRYFEFRAHRSAEGAVDA